MSDLRIKFLSSVLDSVEQRESRLLVWGIVEGYFQRSELSDIINPMIESALESGYDDFFKTSEVISALLDLKWLVEIDCSDGEVGYRSRMSETVRLLQRLRQLFPKHARTQNGWQDAPTLVSDFRFQRRQRQYPKRDLTRFNVLERIRAITDNQFVLTSAEILLGSIEKDLLLSGFQVRAIERILHGIETNQALATIICAGTGSGKTLAFYLPALASITRHCLNDNSPSWVKAIALYPRSELLKDQLREVIGRTIGLNKALNGITVRVGALYGDTPLDVQWCSWDKVGRDFICPSLKCVKCNGDMLWHQTDYSLRRERLQCHDCGWVIEGDVFPLTRKSLALSPPDILFTTTEMLNQRLSDNSLNHLFGIGANAARAPELVLLDEVHTYDGRHGAQVAYLMRRWTHLVQQPLRFVGLSATLQEASTFFSSLTGVKQPLVCEISPHIDEIETEGAEYMIALRGDPVSRAALLSSTIQTTMLLQRCLDPKTGNPKDSVSRGVFGQRTFVFTDDLDVTNRLYFDLLSAEGRTSNGNPDFHNAPNGGLAVLRRSGPSSSRYRGGQDWRMCEQLGHVLTDRLFIERVSSQDRGIDTRSEVVVATAALEVGFDDPFVGAVVQHKAPKGVASFLQRKGRAGRMRGMRPWTTIVLSDYGRDRIAYQGYDLLFDPLLPSRTLPLSNRYITRMQAVFAAIDYFGQKLQDSPKGSVWKDLSEPPKSHQRAAQLVKELRSVLESENSTNKLKTYLCRALRIPREVVSAILWEYPRPLMTMVLPTALRRLVSGWRLDGREGADIQVRNNPLPEFIPATLFADLNLAEVKIKLPHEHERDGQNKQDTMTVFSAMREFSPGRVSRRFGVQYRTQRYWIAPTQEALTGTTPSNLEIDEIGTYIFQGTYSYCKDDKRIDVPVFRPLSLTPSTPAANISDTSQAYLNWFSQFVPVGQPSWLEPPEGSEWRLLIPKLGFFTHARHAPVEVRRFATGSLAEIGIGPGEKVRLGLNFSHTGAPAALGAAFSADGVAFQVHIPDRLSFMGEESAEKWRALRTIRYFDAAWCGKALPSVPSPFMREWLAQVFLSAITYEAIQANIGLSSAAESVISGTASIALSQVLLILFQSQAFDAEEGTEFPGQDLLRRDIEELLVQPTILGELAILTKFLWEPLSEEWEPWLRSTFHCTLGSALMRTIGSLCPSIDLEDLSIDLERGPEVNAHLAPCDPTLVEVWITEKSPGGSGLIEEFMQSYADDPRRFFSMVRATLEMGEFELIDHQLVKLLNLLGSEDIDTEIKKLVNKIRKTTGHDQLLKTSRELRLALLREGFSPFHGFLVSMWNRIIRPGAGPYTDRYLKDAITRWCTEEQRLGLEIDVRVICYWLSQTSDIDAIIEDVGINAEQNRNAWRLSAIHGLLWPRGRSIRQSQLKVRNAFHELPPVERFLVINAIHSDYERVSVENSDWMEKSSALLARGRLVTLFCEAENHKILGSALHTLITNPVEAGYIRAYARLQGVRQNKNLLEADIELLEAVQ